MQAFLITDHDALGAKVRQVLVRHGHDCPTSRMVSLDLAAAHLTLERPELVVVVLSPHPERALGVLADLVEHAVELIRGADVIVTYYAKEAAAWLR